MWHGLVLASSMDTSITVLIWFTLKLPRIHTSMFQYGLAWKCLNQGRKWQRYHHECWNYPTNRVTVFTCTFRKTFQKAALLCKIHLLFYSCATGLPISGHIYVKSNSVINTLLEAIECRYRYNLQNTKQAVKKFYCCSYTCRVEKELVKRCVLPS